jgi:hypothetical protein
MSPFFKTNEGDFPYPNGGLAEIKIDPELLRLSEIGIE